MSYIGADELVFYNDKEKGIHSGGFSVNSIMMKEGISPIITLNNNQNGGGSNVSDIFNDLVVPNWSLSYHNKLVGGDIKEKNYDIEDEDDVIDDDLHDKLLDLVREHDLHMKQNKKKVTRKNKNKYGGTKKRKTKL
jgi:hypothetical protein